MLCLCMVLYMDLTCTVLNFWKLTSYCSLKPLWSGMGEVVMVIWVPLFHIMFQVNTTFGLLIYPMISPTSFNLVLELTFVTSPLGRSMLEEFAIANLQFTNSQIHKFTIHKFTMRSHVPGMRNCPRMIGNRNENLDPQVCRSNTSIIAQSQNIQLSS